MHVACVGAGPAGLYLAILMKRADPEHKVVVFERNPPHSANGWGVVFWDDLLDDLRGTDLATAHRVRESAFEWRGQQLVLDDERALYEGSGYGIARSKLLDILTERAVGLGVEITYRQQVAGPGELGEPDVVVASDGVNSVLRRSHESDFGSDVVMGRNKYVWLGTDKVLDRFTFHFAHNRAGWIWSHAYGFDPNTSTFVIECTHETWTGLGLDTLSARDSLTMLESIFAKTLAGHRLLGPDHDDRPLPWQSFRTLTNRSWSADKMVLAGDAAHTTHFSIGSGTRLAFQDAIALAAALQGADTPQAAFPIYERRRRRAMLRDQNNARLSAQWLEDIARYGELPAQAFFSLVRARRDPLLPHVSPKLYYRIYSAAERTPVLRSAKRRYGPRVRELYSRLIVDADSP